MLKVEETDLTGVRVIQPLTFEDHRGDYVETYNEKAYFDAGIDVKFIQDDYSKSMRGVLRGLHGDNETWKLVYCPHGKFYLVVVNCIKENPDFGKWQSFVLSEHNKKQVLIPPDFGNGHLVLSEYAIFGYKQSAYYNPGNQFSYRYDNPEFNIWWPLGTPTLSRRDECGHYVT